MVMSNVFPVHAVNRYLWSRIEAHGILSRDNYNGLTPIVPVEETPDLLTIIDAQPGVGSHPYIVYAWNKLNNNGSEWYLKTHQIAYAVRSADDDKLRQLINLFEQEFQDLDRAALRVNQFLGGLPAGNVLKSYQFKHISLSTLGGGLPAEAENGVSESLITVSATFIGQDVYYSQ